MSHPCDRTFLKRGRRIRQYSFFGSRCRFSPWSSRCFPYFEIIILNQEIIRFYFEFGMKNEIIMKIKLGSSLKGYLLFPMRFEFLQDQNGSSDLSQYYPKTMTPYLEKHHSLHLDKDKS